MKYKIAFLMLAILAVFALTANAAAPSASITANAEYYLDSTISAASDTQNAADSTTLWTNHMIEPGWEYVLTIGTPTGTGADSTVLQVRVDCKNSANTVLYRRYTGDTLSGNSPQPAQYSLPFGTTLLAQRATIKLMGTAAQGSQVILPAIQLWKRRMITTTKPWR